MYGIGVIVFLLGLSSSLAQTLTHQDMLTAMDHVFQAVDTNNDSFVDLNELDVAWLTFDADNDGRVSEAEYEQFGTNHAYRGIVFHEMDYDGDGFVGRSAIYGEYAVMDTSDDNIVSRSEFDTYYVALMERAIANHGHLLG